MSYELFQEGPAVYVPLLMLSLVITLLAYGAFPFIFSHTRKKVITRKKYRILCYCVNIAVMMFFIALNGEASSGGPYLIWTSVCSHFGLKTLVNRGVLEGSQPVYNEETKVEPSSIAVEDDSKIVFCRKCGTKLLERSQFCSKCGTKIVKE